MVKIQADGDMIVLVDGKRYTFNPTCCNTLHDPKEAGKAPPMPVTDSEDEDSDLEPEGDMVPGKKVLSNPDDDKGNQKQNLKGNRTDKIRYLDIRIRYLIMKLDIVVFLIDI